MRLPPLPPIGHQVHVNGDVSIDEGAVIAPGVILQADPGCRIAIAAGVCIGMGSILHAHQGNLDVEAGACLGAGVLVIGTGKIGAYACIGAITTIWNQDIEPQQLIPAGSVLTPDNDPVLTPEPAASTESLNGKEPTPEEPKTEPSPETETTVYGQSKLNQLMKTLFPYNQSQNHLPGGE